MKKMKARRQRNRQRRKYLKLEAVKLKYSAFQFFSLELEKHEKGSTEYKRLFSSLKSLEKSILKLLK